MKYLLPAAMALAAGAALAESLPAFHLGSSASKSTAPATQQSFEPPWLGARAALFEAAVAEDPGVGTMPNDEAHAGLMDQGDSCPASDPALEDEGEDGADPHASLARLEQSEVEVAPVEKSAAPDGYRVAEIFARRQALAGKHVQVRGVVVKLTEGILDRTYLHLRDGSGSSAGHDHDLTVTTREPCAVGDTLELSGTLLVDRDLGLGYRYPALLDDASIVARGAAETATASAAR